jgi:hypothetical protein
LLSSDPRVLSSSIKSADGPAVLYSDACLSGWGAVIFANGKINVYAGSFSIVEDIQVLEGRALLRAVQALPSGAAVDGFSELIIRIGNTSLRGSLVRGHHRNFVVNGLAAQILSLCSLKGYKVIAWEYVDSFNNLADAASRIFE